MPQSPDTAVLSIAQPMTRAEACEVLSEHTRGEIDAWLTRYPPSSAVPRCWRRCARRSTRITGTSPRS